ncbi:MAG: class I SAM-dependent methyltransferase [Halobacteriota archaeon]
MNGPLSSGWALHRSSPQTTQEFYTSWADAYDLLAARTPVVGSIRRRAIDALDLAAGDVVVEMGCGTGGNLPYLRDRVGPTGTVIGIDFAAGMLAVARDRVRRHGWSNVHLVRADATTPPVPTPGRRTAVDAVFASFVTGMFDDPASVVDEWASIVGPEGRIGLADLARSSTAIGRVLNPIFGVLVRASSPSGTARTRGTQVERLDRRVAAGHRRLHGQCRDASYETCALGFVRISAGTVS